MDHNKTKKNALQKIRDNIIKQILKTPTTTPSELTTAETGIWDIETQLMKTYHKIVNTRPNESTLYKVTTDPDDQWKKKITNTLMKINIIETEFLGEKTKTNKNNCHPEAK